jgi:hypothetical protein
MPQPELKFTDEQKALYKAALAPQATAEQWGYFITECERRALVPGVHVVFSTRTAKEFSKQLQRDITVEKVTLITTINALRLIAERSGKFEGYGRFTYFYGDDNGDPTVRSEIPLGKIPHAVGVELYRAGWRNPVFSTARYDAYVQLKSDKTPTAMWFKRGEEQLAKCAEANGLRMVAPEECGGLYIEEEWASQQQQDVDATTHVATVTAAPETAPVVIPAANVAPPINQTAAPIETSPVPPQATAPVAAPAAAPASAPPKPPAPPARVAPPKIAAPPVPKAAPAPVSAPPATPAEDPRHRQPAVEQPAHESPAELAEVADRIARDKDPVPTGNIHGVNITDEDLPENLRAPQVAPANHTPVPTESSSTAPSVNIPTPQRTAAPVAETAPTADAPATPAEYQAFMNRAAKIVRDKLAKAAGVKNAGALVKDFLLKKSGKARLQQISAATFEQLIKQLEDATPQDAAALVK